MFAVPIFGKARPARRRKRAGFCYPQLPFAALVAKCYNRREEQRGGAAIS